MRSSSQDATDPGRASSDDSDVSPGAAWSRVMEFDELWEGDLVGVEVGTAKVLLVNVDGEVRAYRDRCPHQEWPLSEGDLDGRVLTCINHLWEFDAVSGEGINPADAELHRLPCKVEDGYICVAET